MYSYPDKPPDALNGMVQILDKNVGTGLMQYYVNVIPTLHNEAVAESNMVASSHYTYTVKFKSIYGYEVSAKSTSAAQHTPLNYSAFYNLIPLPFPDGTQLTPRRKVSVKLMTFLVECNGGIGCVASLSPLNKRVCPSSPFSSLPVERNMLWKTTVVKLRGRIEKPIQT